MPIYEFQCDGCGHIFELLSRIGDAEESLRCPECAGEELTRVMSAASFSMGNSAPSGSGGPQLTSRSCSGGSCSTITLPGHSK